MNIVIPMAGEGSRFPRAIYKVPKPLIPVANEPMYRWAVRGLHVSSNDRLIFILRKDEFTSDIVQDIKASFGHFDLHIRVLEKPTSGQAETVLAAEDLFVEGKSLLIHNADTCVEVPTNWAGKLNAWDGALVVFQSSEPRWSYARTDATGSVVEVREKEVISTNASTGTYWFARLEDFTYRARAAIAQGSRVGGEYYVAPLFNGLLADGGSVTLVHADSVFCFGTPADLTLDEPRFVDHLQPSEPQNFPQTS